MPQKIARIALPVPLDKQFDYTVPEGMHPVIGGRVSVSFGPQKLMGIVTDFPTHSDVPSTQLKPIRRVVDTLPLWENELYQLLQWCSQYYQYPLGDTLSNALPSALRKGKAAAFEPTRLWRLTELGKDKLMQGLDRRAIKQAKVLRLLSAGERTHAQLLAEDVSGVVLNTLEKKGWIESETSTPEFAIWPEQVESSLEKPRLNQEQAIAISTVNSHQGFGCFLLQGVTGSGKTEVYLNLITPVLARRQQALVLVPEIGLTPQTIQRFRERFQVPVTVMHSGLNETERLTAWLSARHGQAGIIIGTRSALFSSFQNLGIIIVDEEHDLSYKQQDSLRYHARDVAVMRAHLLQIPIVLGSATPALESIYNAQIGKYYRLSLTQRAGAAVPTSNRVLDMKGQYMEGGLSAPLIAEMRRHLNAGNQVLLFLNRRGYAPVLMCHDCGWMADCPRCESHFTYHQSAEELRCHHCGTQRPATTQCQQCHSHHMVTVGVGTEQLEQQLAHVFPEFNTIRIDRDSTRRKGALEDALGAIHNNQYQILIGTQMLAKGHHFPKVTLVALLDVDNALFSGDFRASERLAQLFIQVAGRAGRASQPGEVLLQTHHPEHALLQTLLTQEYPFWAQAVLKERQFAQLPPFSFLALIRAESHHSDQVENFLSQVRQTLSVHPLFEQGCSLLGPSPAPMAKRAGKYRWQLLIRATHRRTLQTLLKQARAAIQLLPLSNKVRWSLDIEPQDLS